MAITLAAFLCSISATRAQEGLENEPPAVPGSVEVTPVETVEEADFEQPAPYNWFKEDAYYEENLTPREVDKTTWEKAIQGLNYTQKVENPKKNTPNKDKTPPDFSFFSGLGDFFAWFFRGLLIAVGLTIIVLLVRNLIQVKLPPRDVAFQTQSLEKLDLKHIEENLNTADLDPLLQRAIEQENYSLAVRLYYLSVLKKLSQQKLVFWKKDKTNRDYLQELHATPFQQPFQQTTRAFEWVWYGDMAIGKQEFERVQAQFKDMLLLIQQNNRP